MRPLKDDPCRGHISRFFWFKLILFRIETVTFSNGRPGKQTFIDCDYIFFDFIGVYILERTLKGHFHFFEVVVSGIDGIFGVDYGVEGEKLDVELVGLALYSGAVEL